MKALKLTRLYFQNNGRKCVPITDDTVSGKTRRWKTDWKFWSLFSAALSLCRRCQMQSEHSDFYLLDSHLPHCNPERVINVCYILYSYNILNIYVMRSSFHLTLRFFLLETHSSEGKREWEDIFLIIFTNPTFSWWWLVLQRPHIHLDSSTLLCLISCGHYFWKLLTWLKSINPSLPNFYIDLFRISFQAF